MTHSKPATRTTPSDLAPPDEKARQDLRLALSLLDLTTLHDDDSPARVLALCERAVDPLAGDARRAALTAAERPMVAAVCIFDRFVPIAVRALSGTGVRVASVTGGFPEPVGSLDERTRAVAATVADGATEVDVVITRAFVLDGRWAALADEVSALREAAGSAHLKTILAAGALGPLENVAEASRVCLEAGAHFVKTSTGREAVNATPEIGRVMMRAIRVHYDATGIRAGFKAAGGIRTAADACLWMRLARDELGPEWLTPDYFRIGASSLLDAMAEALRARPTRPRS